MYNTNKSYTNLRDEKVAKFHKDDVYSPMKILETSKNRFYVGKIMKFFGGKTQNVALSKEFATEDEAKVAMRTVCNYK